MRTPEIDEHIRRWLTLHQQHFPSRWGYLYKERPGYLDKILVGDWYQRYMRRARLKWPDPMQSMQARWPSESDYKP